MKKSIVFGLLTVILVLAIASGTPKKTKFWKGNMHTHSYWSDGDTYPEEVAYWFKSNGYNFLAVTDHNILQETDKWYHVDRNKDRRANYEEYLKHFGGVGLDTDKRDDGLWVKLRKIDDYRQEFEKDNEFILISSEEITDGAEGKPVHLGAINSSNLIKPTKGETVAECLKMNVDEMRRNLMKDGNPEWIIVNHPNFGWALEASDIANSGARFFEVFNGHPSVRNYGSDDYLSTEDMWDEANRIRIINNQEILYGVANDDSHNYLDFKVGKANPGRGWTMVRSENLTTESLYSAMLEGDFYASTGVELEELKVSSKSIRIKILSEPEINYTIEFIAWVPGENRMKIVSTVKGSKATYKFTGDEGFVRARISSTELKENPYQEGDYEMAWTQPVLVN